MKGTLKMEFDVAPSGEELLRLYREQTRIGSVFINHGGFYMFFFKFVVKWDVKCSNRLQPYFKMFYANSCNVYLDKFIPNDKVIFIKKEHETLSLNVL